jgi:hypothetical protein
MHPATACNYGSWTRSEHCRQKKGKEVQHESQEEAVLSTSHEESRITTHMSQAGKLRLHAPESHSKWSSQHVKPHQCDPQACPYFASLSPFCLCWCHWGQGWLDGDSLA